MDLRKNTKKTEEDRISGLPDDLIHHILSSAELKLVVQTSVLSKRWKFIWTTLPFLSFHNDVKFVDKFLSQRNDDAEIYKLNLSLGFQPHANLVCKVDKYISYAMTHKVQVLNVEIMNPHAIIRFSMFTSTFVQNLSLNLNFDRLSECHCWDLPELTTLHLTQYPRMRPCKLPESYLICLHSLQTLFLEHFELPDSLSLPTLETLSLRSCSLPSEVWDLPALLNLTLDDIVFSDEDTSAFFSALINLRGLILCFRTDIRHDWVIDCPGLENLDIKDQRSVTSSHWGKIIVLSRKICNFCSVGCFPTTFEDSELKHVNIKLSDSTKNSASVSVVTEMFSGLGSARTLTLDSEIIKVLSFVGDHFVYPPSPFYNLKYVRIPPGYKESSMSASLKSYLLDRSPKATLVTTSPKKMIPHIEAVSVTAPNVVIEETMLGPRNFLADSESIHKSDFIDTVEQGVREKHAVQYSEVHANRDRHVDALVKGNCNDQMSFFRGNSDSGLWRGFEVNAEFVVLLDQITSKYPRTFEHFTIKNKKFCEMKLNMLCTSVIDFTKTHLTEVDTKLIDEYRDVFADLQKLGFNVSWLVNRLNYIEQLHISQPLPELHSIDSHIYDAESILQDLQICIDDAKIKFQDLQTLRSEKMQEMNKPVGTNSTSLGYDSIGYNLLSGP